MVRDQQASHESSQKSGGWLAFSEKATFSVEHIGVREWCWRGDTGLASRGLFPLYPGEQVRSWEQQSFPLFTPGIRPVP